LLREQKEVINKSSTWNKALNVIYIGTGKHKNKRNRANALKTL